jgi:hypothetical protein
MDAWNDLEDMGQSDLDAATTERLLTGDVPWDDAPFEFDRVAALIGMAQGPATVEELSTGPAIVSAFAARAQAPSVVRGGGRRRLWSLRFPAKVLGVAVPVAFLGASVAAATGSLPSSAQSAVSRVLSDIGISVPNPQNANHDVEGSPGPGTPGGTALDKGFVSPGSATLSSLCAAWQSGNPNHHSASYRDLVAAAGSARAVSAYCQDISVSVAPARAATNAKVRTPYQLKASPSGSTNATTGASKRAASGASPPRHRDSVPTGKREASVLQVRRIATWPRPEGPRCCPPTAVSLQRSRPIAGQPRPPGTCGVTLVTRRTPERLQTRQEAIRELRPNARRSRGSRSPSAPLIPQVCPRIRAITGSGTTVDRSPRGSN